MLPLRKKKALCVFGWWGRVGVGEREREGKRGRKRAMGRMRKSLKEP